MSNTIAKNIKFYRKQCKMSQRALAEIQRGRSTGGIGACSSRSRGLERWNERMRITIGSDHGAVALKEEVKMVLKEYGDIEVTDVGTFGTDAVDYPDIAAKVEKMAKKYGILYSVLPDVNKKDGLSEVIFHTEAVPRVKMKKQMSYANAKNIPFVVLAGENEMAAGKVTLKNMESGDQTLVTAEELIATVK